MKHYISALIAVLFAITLIPARATAYCLPGITASGEPVREGICSGGSMYYGKTINIYQRMPDNSVGSLIDTYECLDKGGTDAIRNGYVIDIWQPDLEACHEYMKMVYMDGCQGKIYVEILEE